MCIYVFANNITQEYPFSHKLEQYDFNHDLFNELNTPIRSLSRTLIEIFAYEFFSRPIV